MINSERQLWFQSFKVLIGDLSVSIPFETIVLVQIIVSDNFLEIVFPTLGFIIHSVIQRAGRQPFRLKRCVRSWTSGPERDRSHLSYFT